MAEHPHSTLIRKAYTAFTRGDLEAVGDCVTSDATHHFPGNNPLAGDYKGRQAMLDLYRRLYLETDRTIRPELMSICVDGRGHVVAVHRLTAERKGGSLDCMEALVFRVTGDKITDIDECVDDIERLDAFLS